MNNYDSFENFIMGLCIGIGISVFSVTTFNFINTQIDLKIEKQVLEHTSDKHK